MKKIIFLELKLSTFFIVLILKIFFFKVYYLRVSKLFRNIYLLKVLKILNIHWLSYHDNNTLLGFSQYRADSIKFSKVLAKKTLIKLWNEKFKKVFIKKKYLYVALHKIFKERSDLYTELILSAKLIRLKKSEKIYFWADQNFISLYIFSKYRKHSNINLNLSYLSYFLIFYKYFIKISLIVILRILKKIRIWLSFQKKNKDSVNFNNYIDTTKDEVLYFTHKGASASINVNDNIYYSKNKKSNCYHKKILHLEWSKKDISNSQSKINFYKKNEMRLEFFENYKTNFKEKVNILFRLILFLSHVKSKNDPFLIEIISETFLQLESAKIKIKNFFPNTKIAFVQYEYLFPVLLAVALKTYNIKIVTSQTKMIMPHLGENYLTDIYLVIGKRSLLDIKKKQISKPKIILLGMKNNKLEKKNSLKKKIIKHIFVYDIKSIKDWYINGRRGEHNWKENFSFYSLIVEKAKLYKNTTFYIKGKNYDWINIPYFKKVFLQIKKQKNIIILNNLSEKQIHNYYKKTDLFLTIYNSGVDLAIAKGKPAIIYDVTDDIFIRDYGKFRVTTKKQLDILLNDFYSNYHSLNLQLNKIRENFYSKSNFLKARSLLDKC